MIVNKYMLTFKGGYAIVPSFIDRKSQMLLVLKSGREDKMSGVWLYFFINV